MHRTLARLSRLLPKRGEPLLELSNFRCPLSNLVGEIGQALPRLHFLASGLLNRIGCLPKILSSRAGESLQLGESLRRLGRVRIATKYPRIAARHFAESGRQAEIVEVKGSVELAPLTGLVDGIVDLTATGRTLAENDLEVVEDIASSTARLIANPVAHKLKAEAIDGLVEQIRGMG